MERPILFSGPMVRAILDGRKTVTRRVVKGCDTIEERDDGTPWPYYTTWTHGDDGESWMACPFGVPGDRLWVRESFRYSGHGSGAEVFYPADLSDYDRAEKGPWKPSIHMPREASRITLEVVSVRVERLQAIDEDDVLAEGVEVPCDGECGATPCAIAIPRFVALWDGINGDRAPWASNPWVWRVEFRAVQP